MLVTNFIDPRRRLHREKIRLELDLSRFFRSSIRRTRRMLAEPDQAADLTQAALAASKLRLALQRLPSDAAEDALRSELTQAGEQIRRQLATLSPERCDACRAWGELLALVEAAERRLPAIGIDSVAVSVNIASDLLLSAHARLFPAERMLVASGRREGPNVLLSTLFDVTGQASSGHVRADPQALGRSLILMETAGSFLAGWIHSHPGAGPSAACPSSTDLNQYLDWHKHYSPHLLCAIIVRDGWVRFWGENVESGQVCVKVIGSGVESEKNDETLYRLAI